MINVLKNQANSIMNDYNSKRNARVRKRILGTIEELINTFNQKYPLVIYVEKAGSQYKDTLTIKNEFHWISFFSDDKGLGSHTTEDVKLDDIKDFEYLKNIDHHLNMHYNRIEEKEYSKLKRIVDDIKKYE